MQPAPTNFIDLDLKLNPFKYCMEYLDLPLSIYKINGNNKNIIKCALEMIDKCVESIDKKGTPHPEFQYSVIEQALNFLIHLIVEQKNEKYFDRFIRDFAFLAHNVNMNTIKNETVVNKCMSLDRFSKKTMTLKETIILFGGVTRKLTNWKNYTPPSFKLSDHYLRVIKEE
jgi:hypothetical protein